MEQLLTEKQTAQLLCISLATIRRWRKSGKAPSHFLFGSVLRYRLSDVEKFISEHTK
jgi:excisionase family DNA binding protein